MNKKKPATYKRAIAYIIDLLIVTLLSGILAVVFTNNKAYEKDSEKLMDLTKKLTSGEIDEKGYYEEFDSLNYELTKDSVAVTAITCGVSIIYYAILCYYCHGITLGKYIMKIKIVSNNGKKLNLGNYLLRCLVINMVLSNVLSIVLVETLSKSSFITIYSKVSNGFTLLMLLSFILIMYREDGRGIEDFMGNTRIINIKDELLEENNEQVVEKNEIKEATIVNEVKEKKNSKKKNK